MLTESCERLSFADVPELDYAIQSTGSHHGTIRADGHFGYAMGMLRHYAYTLAAVNVPQPYTPVATRS